MRIINTITLITFFFLGGSCVLQKRVLTTNVYTDYILYIEHTPHRDYISKVDLRSQNKEFLYSGQDDKLLKNLSPSPDDHLIAFQEGNEKEVGYDIEEPGFRTFRLKILNLKTNKIHEIASTTMIELQPYAWAPTSRFIAYDNEDTTQKKYFLCTYDLNTNKESLLKDNLSIMHADWSPSGKFLAIITLLDQSIRIINTETNQEKEWLTPFPYNDTDFFYITIDWLNWLSNDTLLYLTNHNKLVKEDILSGKKIILDVQDDIDFSNITLSPDRKYLLATGQTQSESKYLYNIFCINIEDGTVERLTVSGRDLYPSWAPDGQSIIYVSSKENQGNIYIVDMNTRQTRLLIQGKENQFSYPVWVSQ